MSSGTLSVSASSRPISVDLPSSTEPHATTRTIGCSSQRDVVAARRGRAGRHQKYPSVFLLSIEPPPSPSISRPDRSDRRSTSISASRSSSVLGGRLDRGGERVAAEGAEPHAPHLRLLAVLQRVAVVVDHDQLAAAVDDRPLARRSTAAPRGCSRAGCSATRRARSSWTSGRPASSGPRRAGCWRCARTPAAACAAPSGGRARAARTPAPWPGTAPRRGGPRRRPRRSRPRRAPARSATVFMIRVYSWVPWVNGRDALRHALLVGVHQQVDAELGGRPVAELDHLAELPGGVDVQDRERHLARRERLDGEVQQDRGVLADAVEHHRAPERAGGLPEDVDRLGLERVEDGVGRDGGLHGV